MQRSDWWRLIAGMLGAAGVALAAAAAHVLAEPGAAAAVERASVIAMVHAAALLAAAPLPGRAAGLACLGFALGTALFSGSIALRHLAGAAAAGPFAPAGGICLILAWVCLALTAARR